MSESAELVQRVVLFADLRGSTALFERCGTAEASAVVGEAVARLAEQVRASGGELVKTLGDGLLALFADAPTALAAASTLPQALDGDSVHAPAAPMAMQLALAAGEVARRDGDCRGDAVNVAARLLGHASDHECLLTAEVHAALTPAQAARCRALPQVHLRGRIEPVAVFACALAVPHPRGDAEAQATHFGEALLASPATPSLQLNGLGCAQLVHPADCPYTLGRGDHADWRVDAVRVSRIHARIDAVNATLVLADLSINGTYLRFAGEDELLSLRRGVCTLHGSGQIGLGGAPGSAGTPTLAFQVIAATPARA